MVPVTAKFTPEVRGRILQGLYAGLTLGEAAAGADVAEQTLKNWCTRGREEQGGEHAAFVVAVDEARDCAARSHMSFEEYCGHVNRAVRAGSVAAMRLWASIHHVDEPAEPDAVDALRARRRARLGEDPFARPDGTADRWAADSPPSRNDIDTNSNHRRDIA